MKPLINTDFETGTATIYACAHWRSFPPKGAGGPLTAEELRDQKIITPTDYQRFLVWQRSCGLTVMEQSKCQSCPLFRNAEVKKGLPVLTTLDGKLSVPAVDLPTLELRPKGGVNSGSRVHLRLRPPPQMVGKVPGGKVS